MRNFSSRSTYSSTYVVDETTELGDPSFVRIIDALLISMGRQYPEQMVPSEEQALANFIGWFEENKARTLYSALPKSARSVREDLMVVSPTFVFHNLSEGHSVVVIWADSKGKIAYLL